MPLDEVELHGLFPCNADLPALSERLRRAGVPEKELRVLSPVPLSSRASDRIGRMPLYAVTIGAGILGIGVGVFFAAGTAAMYPLVTGGKPIVAAPVVGIISYETMMLLAIVVTFLTMLVRIKRANGKIAFRDVRIGEGRIAVVARVPLLGPTAGAVQNEMEVAGALDVQLTVVPSDEQSAPTVRQAASLLLPLLIGLLGSCSQDMQEQPSYHAQEAPRRHSPPGSVPRQSRRLLPIPSANMQAAAEVGTRLFQINCVHCHGIQGEGDGPVAAFLKEQPANLKGEEVRGMSEEAIYKIVTEGKDQMPSFEGELSAAERLEVARHVASLSRPSVAQRGAGEAR